MLTMYAVNMTTNENDDNQLISISDPVVSVPKPNKTIFTVKYPDAK